MIIHKIEVIRRPKPCAGTLVLRSEPDAPPVELLQDGSPAPVSARLFTKMRRLRQELTTWAKAGAVIVPKEVRRERLAICSACSYYDPKGNLGLGECKFPGCGCSRVKAALATSKCPHKPPKWGAWAKPNEIV